MPQIGFRRVALNYVVEGCGLALDDGVDGVHDGFAVRSDANIYVSVSDHVKDGSKFGPICALARAIKRSTDIIFTIFGNKSSPPASGKDRRFAMDGGTIRVPMDVYVSVFSGGNSCLLYTSPSPRD